MKDIHAVICLNQSKLSPFQDFLRFWTTPTVESLPVALMSFRLEFWRRSAQLQEMSPILGQIFFTLQARHLISIEKMIIIFYFIERKYFNRINNRHQLETISERREEESQAADQRYQTNYENSRDDTFSQAAQLFEHLKTYFPSFDSFNF